MRAPAGLDQPYDGEEEHKVVKFIESKDVPGLIKDGDTIYSTGMMLAGLAEEAFMQIERSFLDSGHPRDLSWYFPAGQGNFKDKGMARPTTGRKACCR